jgi:fatty acid-binding protein DegV
VRLSLFYSTAPELADQMREALDEAGADYVLDSTGFIGSVIGTYAGPGAVGLAYYPIR